MKEITVEPLLDKHFKKKETCTMVELYRLVEDYRKKHPDVYVQYDRDSVHWEIESHGDKFYWDSKESIIRKQYVVHCPCCESQFRLYPDSEKYMNVLIYIEEELWKK